MGSAASELAAMLAALTLPLPPLPGIPGLDPAAALGSASQGSGQFGAGSALGSLSLPLGSGVLSAAPLLLSVLSGRGSG